MARTAGLSSIPVTKWIYVDMHSLFQVPKMKPSVQFSGGSWHALTHQPITANTYQVLTVQFGCNILRNFQQWDERKSHLLAASKFNLVPAAGISRVNLFKRQAKQNHLDYLKERELQQLVITVITLYSVLNQLSFVQLYRQKRLNKYQRNNN